MKSLKVQVKYLGPLKKVDLNQCGKITKITIGNKMVDFERKNDSFFLYYDDFEEITIEMVDK